MHTLEKVMKIRSEETHPNGMIYENELGYNTETGGGLLEIIRDEHEAKEDE